MKNIHILVLLLLSTLYGCNNEKVTSISKPKNPDKYAATITTEELKEMLYEFAGDSFLGREVGTEGEAISRDYIIKHYETTNIDPAEGTNNFEQKVALAKIHEPDAAMFINGVQYTYFDDFFNTVNTANFTLNTDEIIYAGYGIHDKNYSDYSKVDVKGKVILIKRGEPVDKDGNYIITGTSEKSKWSKNYNNSILLKREEALKQGAKAVLFYENKIYGYVRNVYKSKTGRLGLLDNEQESFIYIHPTLAKMLHPEIDKEFSPKTISTNLIIQHKRFYDEIDAKNVVATIKGSEFPNEYIILSAHLDHLGEGANGEVFNGADDDGSGTVAIMEIAEAFQKAKEEKNGPRRSIVFLHVTGEEYGLFGSKHYTDLEPLYPLENTVVNLNIDMIGRVDDAHLSDPNYLYLIGSDKLSKELHEVSEEINQKYGNLTFDYTYNDENDPNRFYYRSDHYNFAKNNIPIIFYFNGTHADYHKATDTPDKIEYDLLRDRTKVIFHTAWELANRDKRIALD